MAQRLVLKAKDGLIPVHEIQSFTEVAVAHGVRLQNATYEIDKDKNLLVMLTLPKNVRVVGRRQIKMKPKTKKQQAVEDQIAQHEEDKKTGNAKGYVPPVGRKTASKPQKIKCPACDTKKQIVTVAGQRMVKPHVSKGKECPGSGAQIVSGGRGVPLRALYEQPKKKKSASVKRKVKK